MKTFLTTTCAVALMLGGAAFAAQEKGTPSRQSKEVQQDTKTTTPNQTVKTATDTVYGKVETFEAGKSLKVTVPGKNASTKSFDLSSKDETVNVPANLKAGEWVSVMEKTDNNGHKTVTVKPSTKHMKKTTD